jgi:hypothetical protein
LALAITIAVLEFFIKSNVEAKQTKVKIKIDENYFYFSTFFRITFLML